MSSALLKEWVLLTLCSVQLWTLSQRSPCPSLEFPAKDARFPFGRGLILLIHRCCSWWYRPFRYAWGISVSSDAYCFGVIKVVPERDWLQLAWGLARVVGAREVVVVLSVKIGVRISHFPVIINNQEQPTQLNSSFILINRLITLYADLEDLIKKDFFVGWSFFFNLDGLKSSG